MKGDTLIVSALTNFLTRAVKSLNEQSILSRIGIYKVIQPFLHSKALLSICAKALCCSWKRSSFEGSFHSLPCLKLIIRFCSWIFNGVPPCNLNDTEMKNVKRLFDLNLSFSRLLLTFANLPQSKSKMFAQSPLYFLKVYFLI
jgi:hypothetical protein